MRRTAIIELETPRSREEMLQMPIAAGSSLLEGWSDEGAWSIALPWPRETRALEWSDAAEWSALVAQLEPRELAPDPLPRCPFLGGWVGLLCYEAAALSEAVRPRGENPPEPPAFFVRHDAGLARSPEGRCFLFAPQGEESRHLEMISLARAPVSLPPRLSQLHDSMQGSAFRHGVDAIREAIRQGDVYQVNLTRRYETPTPIDPAVLYGALAGDQPPRTAALLRGSRWAVASASPETLLRFDRRSGIAESRPIKGTVRRRGDDASEISWLLASQKDASEHLMIVDLVRNDLGKVAPPGHVSVSAFRTVRTLPHVHHMESTVCASGLGDASVAALLQALSPGGSITGAPKRAAVGMIRELEAVPRGVYTGSIGFIDDRGTSEFSVAIRTAVTSAEGTRYHAGGGIVWDSDPAVEEAECRAKSVAFLNLFGEED